MRTVKYRAAYAAMAIVLLTGTPAFGQAITEDPGADIPEADTPEADTIVLGSSPRRRVGPTEELIVTTRKIEENLKDVPLSITAFDANLIEAANITTLQDVADLTPGLTFFNAFGENLPVPIIRGVAQTDIFGETNAAVFVDGVYVAGREGLNFSQLDVERIEVVKGPQSALYGRTAFSGAINYVTKRPAEEFESRVDVEAGNRGRGRASALISGPILGQALRGRVAALYDEWEGSYDNTEYPDTPVGGRVFRSFQGSLVWDPTESFEVYGSLYHSNDDIDDPAVIGVAANCENRIDEDQSDVRLLNYCGAVPKLKDVPSPGPGLISQDSLPKIERALGENRELLRGILNANWDLDFGSFTSLTGYSKTEQNSLSDFGHLGDNIPYLYCSGATVEAPGVPNTCLNNPADLQFLSGVLDEEFGDEVEEISQELRFTSNRDQRLRYTVGGYFYTSTSKGFDGGIINQAPLPGIDIGLPPFDADAPNLAIGTAIFSCGFTDDGCLDPLNRPFFETDTDSWAAFAGMDFDFTDRLIGRLELRYTKQKETVRAFTYFECADDPEDCGDDIYDLDCVEPVPEAFDSGNPCDSEIDPPASRSKSGSEDFSSVTGRLGLDFRLNDAWMIYGSVATGDKPGGIEFVNADAVTPSGTEPEVIQNSFDTETLTAYEVGLKGITLDGRISLDAALFFNDWGDIVLRQLVEVSPDTGRQLEQPEGFRFNAGTAEVWGWEMTADVGFTENFSGRFTVNWNDSTLTDAKQDTFETFPSFAPDGDVTGNKLLRQPEWTGSASFSYARQIGGTWEGFARFDANYQDKIFIGNDNQSWLPARTVANLRFGADSGRFAITLWVRNLFENDEPIAAFRDIFWSNSDSISPPYQDLGPRPSFDKFVPIRYTVTYPTLRTYGVNVTARFGAAAR